jgi:hypothetical protein
MAATEIQLAGLSQLLDNIENIAAHRKPWLRGCKIKRPGSVYKSSLIFQLVASQLSSLFL